MPLVHHNTCLHLLHQELDFVCHVFGLGRIFFVLSFSSLKNSKDKPSENLMPLYSPMSFLSWSIMVDFLSTDRIEGSLYFSAFISYVLK